MRVLGPWARRSRRGARRLVLRPGLRSARRWGQQGGAGAAEAASVLQIASWVQPRWSVSSTSHMISNPELSVLTHYHRWTSRFERLPARPSTELREEIFHVDSNPSEVWHARTARVGRAIAHLLGCLAARLSHSSLPLEPLSLPLTPSVPSAQACALTNALWHPVLRRQARPKVRPCPPHASSPPCNPHCALCRSSTRALVHTPLRAAL